MFGFDKALAGGIHNAPHENTSRAEVSWKKLEAIWWVDMGACGPPGHLPLARAAEAPGRYRLDFVSVDPFAKSHSVEENSNRAIDDVAQILTDIATKYKFAVDVPHHTSKEAS
jgi:hypothetical protein